MLIESEGIVVPACVTCTTLVIAVSVLAGTFSSSCLSAVICSPISLTPYAVAPLFMASAVMFSASVTLLLASGDSFGVLESGQYQLFGVNAQSSTASNEMRRFAQTNIPAALALYTSSATCVCAMLIMRPTLPWARLWGLKNAYVAYGNAYSTACFAAAITSYAVLALVWSHSNFSDDSSYAEWTTILTVSGVALYTTLPGLTTFFFDEANSSRIALSFTEGTKRLLGIVSFGLSTCGFLMELTLSFVEFTPNAIPFGTLSDCGYDGEHDKDKCEGFAAFLSSPQWNYFTTWSCAWSSALLLWTFVLELVHLFIKCEEPPGHSTVEQYPTFTRWFDFTRCLIRSIGASISTCLYFCAAALLPADGGQKAQVSRGSASREMIAFVHKHYIQIWPWLLLFLALPMKTGDVRCLQISFCGKRLITPNMLRIIGWIVGPFIPLCFWCTRILTPPEETVQTDPTQTQYPADYPPIEANAIISLLGCGLFPWAMAAGMLIFEGEAYFGDCKKSR
jgi:hypothetical protein